MSHQQQDKIPMLTFYREQKMSPVRQNIDDMKRHFERRQSLCIHLGLSPLTFRNRSIVEVGPGSGHNALYTAAFRPVDYCLVEGNPTGVSDIKALFKHYPEYDNNIRICPTHLAQYVEEAAHRYDVVWCENVLGGATLPKEMLKQLASLVNEDGFLIVTALDEVSTLAESLRRLLAYAVLGGRPASCDVARAARELEPILVPHLQTLKGMSRLHHDWIVDNICLPLSGGYNILSIPDMIETLGSAFTFHSSSPRFVQDWAWYKDLVGERTNLARHIETEYYANLHSFIDYRFHHNPRSEEKNRNLSLLCKDVRSEILALEDHWSFDRLGTVGLLISMIVDDVESFAPETAMALKEAAAIMPKVNGAPALLADVKSFSRWFGRTQQHVSFVKWGKGCWGS